MFGILVLLFTIIPAIEIYLLINIGGALGGVNTILIVVITGIVGAGLAKSQGLAIINKIQKDIGAGQLPADQIIHGLLVFGGGLLLGCAFTRWSLREMGCDIIFKLQRIVNADLMFRIQNP